MTAPAEHTIIDKNTNIESITVEFVFLNSKRSGGLDQLIIFNVFYSHTNDAQDDRQQAYDRDNILFDASDYVILCVRKWEPYASVYSV